MPKLKIGSEVQIKPNAPGRRGIRGFGGSLREIHERGTVGKVARYADWSDEVAVFFPGYLGVFWFEEAQLDSIYVPAIGGAPRADTQRRSAVPGFSGVGVTTEQVYVIGMKVTEKGDAIRLTDPAPYVNTHHDLASERRQFEDTLIYVITDDADGDGFTVTEGGQFYASYRVTAYCCPQATGK